MKIIHSIALSLPLILQGCADDSRRKEAPVTNEITKMTPAEKKAKAPNEAFEAVYTHDEEKVEEISNEGMTLFYVSNDQGETPLMVAIKLKNKKTARSILERMSINDLFHSDEMGRGYVSYLAEAGFADLIDIIAQKYKASLKFYNRYRFSDLDFKDKAGRTALFFAQSRAVAQNLRDHWLYMPAGKVFSKTWWSDFYQTLDETNNGFIHYAASENRVDVIRWAVDELCYDNGLKDTEYFSWAGEVIEAAGSLIQAAPLIPDKFINAKNDAEDTALHIAVRKGHLDSATAIMSCKFTSFGSANLLGRNPLSELVATTEPHLKNVSSARKAIFEKIVPKRTKLWSWIRSSSDYVDAQDVNGQSALHHAAKLADPYFYLELRKIGNEHLRDDLGRSPADIYSASRIR